MGNGESGRRVKTLAIRLKEAGSHEGSGPKSNLDLEGDALKALATAPCTE